MDSSDRATPSDILALAETIFGDRVRANEWLRTPNESLGNVSPASKLDTERGRCEVSQVLNAIAYGGVA